MNQATSKAGRREWIALGVLLLPVLLVSMDLTVLYFAVPSITVDLTPTSAEQLWMIDIYGFVLAGLLITMGTLGDRIGRRLLLLIGAVAFGAGSIAGAFAGSPEMLIAARALQGIGGATLMPSTLALIRNMFHDKQQRRTAVAIWSSGIAAGAALGPVVSGALLNSFHWGSIFLINVPVMVVLLVLAPMLLPEFRAIVRGRFDLLSAVLSLAAVLPLIYGFKKVALEGFDVAPLNAIAVGLLLGAIFVRRQLTRPNPDDRHPAVPVRRNRPVDRGQHAGVVRAGRLLAGHHPVHAVGPGSTLRLRPGRNRRRLWFAERIRELCRGGLRGWHKLYVRQSGLVCRSRCGHWFYKGAGGVC
jgi:MFS transporter, DHA2 family, multidrug resistance protein